MDELNNYPDNSLEEKIYFSASNNRVITRNGIDENLFDEGTKYDLYAITYQANPENLNWDPSHAVLFAREGIETSGIIDYGEQAVYPKEPLNFYAVTYGTNTKPDANINPTGVPTYKVELNKKENGDWNENAELPDLMWTSLLARRAISNNVVTLDFKHTLSKIRFEIAKLEDTTQENLLDNIYIQHLELKGMFPEGVINLADGNYQTSTPTINRIFYNRLNDSGKQYINTTQTGIKKNVNAEKDAEMLIFPRSKDDPTFTVSVTIGKENESDNWQTIECPMEYYETDEQGKPVGEVKPYVFKPNYEYVITLMVTDNSVRLLIVETQIYEWIDVNHEDPQDFFGRPLYFGGTLWMDRNLGATNADPFNHWDECRGYFYQFGRSIPYMIDQTRPSTGMQNIYTYDQNGDRVYGSVYLDKDRTEESVAWMPGEIPQEVYPEDPTGYKFITTKYNDPAYGDAYWLTGDLYPKLPDKYRPDFEGIGESRKAAYFWIDNINNQPCPTGWRIPTPEDIAAFMPDPAMPVHWYQGDQQDFDRLCEIRTGYKEDRVYGTGVTSDVIAGVYILKNKGNLNAFHVRLLLKKGKDGIQNYYEISRIPGSAEDSYADLKMATIESKFDWSHPSEVMTVAATGSVAINNAGLVNMGRSVILRTSQPGNQRATCYTFLLHAVDNQLGIGIQKGSGKAMGANIRCVRDL